MTIKAVSFLPFGDSTWYGGGNLVDSIRSAAQLLMGGNDAIGFCADQPFEPLGEGSGTTYQSRYPYIVYPNATAIAAGTDLRMRMNNVASSGTRLYSGDAHSCSAYQLAADRIKARIPNAANCSQARDWLYLIGGGYANISDTDPATYRTRWETLFDDIMNNVTDGAAAKGMADNVRFFMFPVLSRDPASGAGFPSEAIRLTFNASCDAAWRTAKGIYMPDVSGIPELYGDGAYANTDYFFDGTHQTQLGQNVLVPPLRTMINHMIAGDAP